MNDRERLYNMIIDAYKEISIYWAKVIAEHLLKEGVKLPEMDGGGMDDK